MSATAMLQTGRDCPHAAPTVLELDERRGTFGMALLITAESMLFVVLFAAYYYLGPQTDRWAIEEPPRLHYVIPMLVILVVSSLVIYWGDEKVKKEAFGAGKLALIVTILLGCAFLALSYFDYTEHLRTLLPQSDSYGSIFYTIVSLHVAHLTAGLLMLLWTLFQPRWGPAQFTPHKPYHNAAMYWHFVDTVWVFVVAILYVYPNIVH
jgi:heme/copper-type cytochrome/quinol oxidase subunit 3